MSNIVAFLFVLAQLGLIIAAYYVPWETVFTLMVVQFSPIVIFLSLIHTALEFSGEISYWVIFGLVYCMIKYFIISRAITDDGVGFYDMSALGMEILYLVGSTYYIISHDFL